MTLEEKMEVVAMLREQVRADVDRLRGRQRAFEWTMIEFIARLPEDGKIGVRGVLDSVVSRASLPSESKNFPSAAADEGFLELLRELIDASE